MTSFEELRRVNVARCKRWHPGFPQDEEWTIADWSNAMMGEAGDAANLVKKLRRHETNTHQPARDDSPGPLRAQLAAELADVVIYADLLAAKAGLNLGEKIRAKFNGVSIREGFPERLPERLPERTMFPLGEATAPCTRCEVTTPMTYLDSAGVCVVCRGREES